MKISVHVSLTMRLQSVMGMEVISSGTGWRGWAGAAMEQDWMGWDRCGESACSVGGIGGCKDGVGGLQGSSERLGTELQPLLQQCQPQQRAEGAAGTPGREHPHRAGQGRVWAAACPLPVGAVTVPWGLWVGMLRGHTPNLLFWGIYSAPTPFPVPGCVVGRQGLEQAEMRRVLGGQGVGMLQDTKVAPPNSWGFSHHSPACAALLGAGCGVSVPQFPHVPGDAAPQALPALCLLALGWGGWWWGWWSPRDPQPSHCPSWSRPIPSRVSGTKTPLVWV